MYTTPPTSQEMVYTPAHSRTGASELVTSGAIGDHTNPIQSLAPGVPTGESAGTLVPYSLSDSPAPSKRPRTPVDRFREAV